MMAALHPRPEQAPGIWEMRQLDNPASLQLQELLRRENDQLRTALNIRIVLRKSRNEPSASSAPRLRRSRRNESRHRAPLRVPA